MGKYDVLKCFFFFKIKILIFLLNVFVNLFVIIFDLYFDLIIIMFVLIFVVGLINLNGNEEVVIYFFGIEGNFVNGVNVLLFFKNFSLFSVVIDLNNFLIV